MTRAQEINRWINTRIATRIARGADPLEALREVVGSALVDTMIDEVYNTLRQAPPAAYHAASVPEAAALTVELREEAERAARAEEEALEEGTRIAADRALLETVGADAINRCLGTTAPRSTDYTPRTLTIAESLALVALERWRAQGAKVWALEAVIGDVLEEQYGPGPYRDPAVGRVAIATHDLAVTGARGEGPRLTWPRGPFVVRRWRLGLLSKPGTKLGPCRGTCAHLDCKQTRADAAALCAFCERAIGYGAFFYRGAEGALGHDHCLEHAIKIKHPRAAVFS